MKIADLKREFTINQWLSTVNLRENTVSSYLLGMQVYTEYLNKTPSQLLDEAEQEQDDSVKPRKRLVNKYLPDFRTYLEEKGLASLTIKNYMNGVKSFYRTFDIEFKPILQKGATVKQENKKIPSIEDIRDILKVCDVFERALILTSCSSGLDGSTICEIKIGKFKNGYDPVTRITTLILRRVKTNVDFITFLTPEASEAVWDYLKYRERKIETTSTNRKNQLAKQRVYADSNYLFILRKIPEDFLQDYDEEKRKITRSPLMKIYREISTKGNKSTEKGKFNYIRSHNLRKFFDSTMLNNGCDYFHVEEFMGHSLPGTQGHYYTPNIKELKNYYMKFIPYLTINKALNVSESDEYKQIKNENDILRAETAKHIVERQELQDLRNELQAQESRMNEFLKALETNELKYKYTELSEAQLDELSKPEYQIPQDELKAIAGTKGSVGPLRNIEMTSEELEEMPVSLDELKRRFGFKN